jgi:hypothetical protein
MRSNNRPFFRVLMALIVLTVLSFGLFVLASPVSARSVLPDATQAPVQPGFADLFSQWIALAGAGALIACLINVGKALGWIKDGQAVTWSTGLNALGMIGLLLLQIFKPDVDLVALDGFASQVAQALMILFGLIAQMLSSKGTHIALKGVPVIGKSFTLER